MGLPDTSPAPKKDSMGMDYIPVYEGEETTQHGQGLAGQDPAQRRQDRSGRQTAISRTIKAPGVVQLDERRIAVVAPRFDGYIDKVEPVTSGTHVSKGDIAR